MAKEYLISSNVDGFEGSTYEEVLSKLKAWQTSLFEGIPVTEKSLFRKVISVSHHTDIWDRQTTHYLTVAWELSKYNSITT